MAPNTEPTGWSAVYALVRDTREDLAAQIANVALDVKGVGAKVDTHLLEHAQSKGKQLQTDRIFGIARSSLAVIISIGAFGMTIYNALT